MHSAEQIRKYYREPLVRRRILEFLGADGAKRATCEYITADDEHDARRLPRPCEELQESLDEGKDICRSLWDTKSLIAHLDIEYVNFDRAQEPYENPRRAFALQEPAVDAIKRLLGRCGIRPAILFVLTCGRPTALHSGGVFYCGLLGYAGRECHGPSFSSRS